MIRFPSLWFVNEFEPLLSLSAVSLSPPPCRLSLTTRWLLGAPTGCHNGPALQPITRAQTPKVPEQSLLRLCIRREVRAHSLWLLSSWSPGIWASTQSLCMQLAL